MGRLFVLIHSPLVGPLTWSLVAKELQRREVEVIVPALSDDRGAGLPYWRQHAESVARSLASRAPEHPLILAAHSGAGPLLPAIRQAIGRPVAAYIFVDAGIPAVGASRLDLLRMEDPELSEQFHQLLASGGHYPAWTDADLREILPDAPIRQRLLADVRPRGRLFWEEPIPVFNGWPDAPCSYLQFSPVYDGPAGQARRKDWIYQRIEGGHFHMLVDPAAVARGLLHLTGQMNID